MQEEERDSRPGIYPHAHYHGSNSHGRQKKERSLSAAEGFGRGKEPVGIVGLDGIGKLHCIARCSKRLSLAPNPTIPRSSAPVAAPPEYHQHSRHEAMALAISGLGLGRPVRAYIQWTSCRVGCSGGRELNDCGRQGTQATRRGSETGRGPRWRVILMECGS